MNYLAVDIGNTQIGFALLNKNRVLSIRYVQTQLSQQLLKSKIQTALRSIKREKKVINAAIVCSVVPKKSLVVVSSIENILKIKPIVVGRDVEVPIKNKYNNPKEVGHDRLVCAYAASKLVKPPCIVIDLGTAITVDVISKKRSYEGGLIIPGIKLSAETLFKHTALLPSVTKFEPPTQLIGKTTTQSILSGIFNGYGAMCAGLIDQISSKIKGKPHIIVTGGYTNIMRKYIRHKIDSVEKDLVYKGMLFLIENNKDVNSCK